MTDFCILLAGVPISVSAENPEIAEFCRGYFTELAPQYRIELLPSDIAYEREKCSREAACCGAADTDLSDTSLGILAVYRKAIEYLLRDDVLLFHGVLLEMDGEGYLFIAVSGTGKTTHAKLWLEKFGDRARIINGDKPLLRVTKDGVIGYGTPWCGKERYGCRDCVPLKAVCILQRSAENCIEEVSMHEALPMIMQQAYRPDDPAGKVKTYELIDKMQSLRYFRLGCNMNIEAASVAYEGMR